MASASLLKMLVSGLQDERLLPPKGQPKVDVFQKSYIKAGRFTTETYRVDFDNQPAFGTTARITLPRRGHLIKRVFLVTVMPDISATQATARAWATANNLPFAGPTFGWTNSVGNALLTSASLTIGGAPIDAIEGTLLEVLDEFTTPLEKTTTVNRMIGRWDHGFTPKSNGFSGQQTLITPLPFWFARGDPSVALPIDAIGIDAVQINIGFNTVDRLYTTTSRIKTNDAYGSGQNQVTEGDTIQKVPTSGSYVSNKCNITYTNYDTVIASQPPAPRKGNLAMPPMASSPFFVLDPNGTEMYGLNGNPEKSVRVRQIPGIKMADSFEIAESYLLVEYVYIDKPEANRIRLSDLTYPILQHYSFTQDTKGASTTRINMRVPNMCRQLFITCHRNDADLLNAPFLMTRDLSGTFIGDASGIGLVAPWWPDAQGLSLTSYSPHSPAYSAEDSEPISSLSLNYEGRIVRYSTQNPAFYRSILPSLEQRKSPWHNKYIYNLPFGTSLEEYGVGVPTGHANLDKIQKLELSLAFKPLRGSVSVSNVPTYTVSVWVETYNILKVYGGRGGLLFSY
jgi:hypothetical protein